MCLNEKNKHTNPTQNQFLVVIQGVFAVRRQCECFKEANFWLILPKLKMRCFWKTLKVLLRYTTVQHRRPCSNFSVFVVATYRPARVLRVLFLFVCVYKNFFVLCWDSFLFSLPVFQCCLCILIKDIMFVFPLCAFMCIIWSEGVLMQR